MAKPTYDLEKVKRLVASECFSFAGRSGSIQHLEHHLVGELWRYGEFAQRVIEEISPGDFHDSRRWPEPAGPFADEYGVGLSGELLDDFGVKVRNWYMKIRIHSDRGGDEVLVLSLHPLAYDMERVDGTLKAGI